MSPLKIQPNEKLLYIDTSQPIGVVGCLGINGILEEVVLESQKKHAEVLPVIVAEMIQRHKIDALLVNRGPGSFVGIRVGLAFAIGFCDAQNCPLYAVDTHRWLFAEYVAKQTFYGCRLELAVDGRKNQAYAVSYLPETETFSSCRSITDETLHEKLSANVELGVLIWPEQERESRLKLSPPPHFIQHLSGEGVLQLMERHIKIQRCDRTNRPSPLYIRTADVRKNPNKNGFSIKPAQ